MGRTSKALFGALIALAIPAGAVAATVTDDGSKLTIVGGKTVEQIVVGLNPDGQSISLTNIKGKLHLDGVCTEQTVNGRREVICPLDFSGVQITGASASQDLYAISGSFADNPASALEFTGKKASDLVSASNQADLLRGGASTDTLSANGGNDLIWGGVGSDTLSAGAGQDTAHGGSGNDTLVNDGGRDHLYGEAGNDAVTVSRDPQAGSGKGDVISTGAGNDIVSAADGIKDQINCGDGTDIATVDHIDVTRSCERRNYPD